MHPAPLCGCPCCHLYKEKSVCKGRIPPPIHIFPEAHISPGWKKAAYPREARLDTVLLHSSLGPSYASRRRALGIWELIYTPSTRLAGLQCWEACCQHKGGVQMELPATASPSKPCSPGCQPGHYGIQGFPWLPQGSLLGEGKSQASGKIIKMGSWVEGLAVGTGRL